MNKFPLDGSKSFKLVKINTRDEKHGKQKVPAIDLCWMAVVSNKWLDRFDPDLLPSLYKGDDDDQMDLIGQEPGELRQLRVAASLVKTITIPRSLEGHRLEIPYGTDDSRNVVLEECKVKNFKLTPQEGGSMILEFQTGHVPEGADVGKLWSMLHSELPILLTPPDAPQSELLFAGDQTSQPQANPFDDDDQDGDEAGATPGSLEDDERVAQLHAALTQNQPEVVTE